MMELDHREEVRRFYEAHRQGLFTYALSLTRRQDLAEDAVHSAILGLLRLKRLPEPIRPYAFRSIRNAIIDDFRANTALQDQVLDPEAAAGCGQDPHQVRLLEQCLFRLSGPEREAVVLKVWGGLTFEEISLAVRSPLATVASRYRRGILHLREMLEGTG